MAVVGLGAFALFAVWRWRAIAALSPMLLLGALALPSSRRFIPYLAPFVGIGWGIIVSLVTSRAARPARRKVGRTSRQCHETSRSPVWLARGAFLIDQRQHFRSRRRVCRGHRCLLRFGWRRCPANYVAPRPAIPAQVFRHLQILAKRLPADSRIWTWWDNGFAIVEATGFGVYHDGAAQYTPQTNLIAASFVESDSRAMHEIIALSTAKAIKAFADWRSRLTTLTTYSCARGTFRRRRCWRCQSMFCTRQTCC